MRSVCPYQWGWARRKNCNVRAVDDRLRRLDEPLLDALALLSLDDRLGPADIDVARVGSAQVTYVEGYLWDAPAAKQAVLKAFDAAHAPLDAAVVSMTSANANAGSSPHASCFALGIAKRRCHARIAASSTPPNSMR